MTEAGPFRVSQGFDVLQPRTGSAYPVPCDEWEFLKRKLREVSTPPWIYHTIGSLLGGTAITTFVTILTGTLPPVSASHALVIEWSVVAASTVCSAACFYFAHQQRRMQSIQVSDVITQMELIEKRYERSVGRSESSAILTILSAQYGTGDNFVDVTSLLAQRVKASGLEVIADNNLAGDPCPGTMKELIVEYEHDGQRRHRTVKEHATLSLP